MSFERQNPIGLWYTIADITPNITVIYLGKKQIEIHEPASRINQAWFNWMMKGQYIQQAFDFLTPEQREFLLTGITPSEWQEIFKDSEQ